MKIDRAVVGKVAALARIKIPEDKIDKMSTDLTEILTFMEQLNNVDTTGVEPLVYMNEDTNRWRADEQKESLSMEDGLKNAPARAGEYFTVPKILEK